MTPMILPSESVSAQPIKRTASRLWFKIWPAVLLTLALAACAGGGPPNQPDFAQGTWDGQTIVPPGGLLTAYQGDLVGRRVDNSIGPTPLTVAATIIDPATAQPRYVVLAGPPDIAPVIVPINALVISPTTIQITATHYALRTLPNFPNLAALELQYPRTVITTPVVVQNTAPALGMLPPVAPLPVAGTPVGPLEFARVGSVVGMPVVDMSGLSIGRVDAVAIVPTTGEVRFAIVAGPNFGPGWYIAVPAQQAQTGPGGQVVLAGSLNQWMQAPRYRSDQLPQAIGVVGMLN